MKFLIFIVMLVAFLVILHRWRGDKGRIYDPPMVFLLAYLFIEYVRPQSMFPEFAFVPWAKVAMGIVLFSLLVDQRYRRGGIQTSLPRRQDTLILALVGVAAVSVVAGVDATNSINPFVNLLKVVILYFVLTRVLNSEARLSAFIWILLILNLKLAQHHIRGFAGEVEHIGIKYAIARGVNTGSGFLGNSGDFGVAMCVVLPLALFAIWWERHRLLKWLAAFSAVVFTVAIYSTGTRGAFLGALVIGAVIWLKMPRKIAVLAAGIMIGVIVLSSAPDAYWDRMETILGGAGTTLGSGEATDRNVATRLDLWEAGLNMSADYPLGVGIGNFSLALEEYVDWQTWNQAVAPHNMFIEALSEVGFAGLAVVLLSFLAAFHRHQVVRLVSVDRGHDGRFPFYLGHGLDGALVGLAVSGSFLTVLYYPHLWLLLGLSVACTNLALTQAKETEVLEQAVGDELDLVMSGAR